MERAERTIVLGLGLLFEALLVAGPVGHARPHAAHRGAAVREGVAPGVQRASGRAHRPPGLSTAAGRPARPRPRLASAARSRRRRRRPRTPVALDLVTTAYRSAAAYCPRRAPSPWRRPDRQGPEPARRPRCPARAPDARSPATSAGPGPTLSGRDARPRRRRHLRAATPATGSSRSACRALGGRGRPPASASRAIDHIAEAQAAGQGAILALPAPRRLGVGRVLAHPGAWSSPVTVVVEPVEPPELFEWFVEFRRQLGMHVVPLGPDGGPRGPAGPEGQPRGRACSPTATSSASGVEVEFFGERTTLPAGPATLGAAHGRAAAARAAATSTGSEGATTPSSGPGRQPRGRAGSATTWPGSPQDLAPRPRGAHPGGAGAVAPACSPTGRATTRPWTAIGKPHPRPAVGPSAAPQPNR